MSYSMTSEQTFQVELTYDVEPGYAGDRIDPPYPASVQNLKATIYGPKGLQLECPSWLADMLAAQEGHDSLILMAEEARADAAYEAWADRGDAA
jgi:hypothetical protein